VCPPEHSSKSQKSKHGQKLRNRGKDGPKAKCRYLYESAQHLTMTEAIVHRPLHSRTLVNLPITPLSAGSSPPLPRGQFGYRTVEYGLFADFPRESLGWQQTIHCDPTGLVRAAGMTIKLARTAPSPCTIPGFSTLSA
jgi:hypothetical protein